MVTILILALNNNGITINLNLLSIADDGKTKVLGNLRTNLGGIAIDGLTTGEDDIIVQIAKGSCQGGRSRPGISAAQTAIRH